MSASEGESQGLSANISAKNTSILCDPSLTKHPHMLSKKWFFTTDNSSVKLLFARKKYIGLVLFIFFNIHLFTFGYIVSWITWVTWNGHVYRLIKSCHFIWSLKRLLIICLLLSLRGSRSSCRGSPSPLRPHSHYQGQQSVICSNHFSRCSFSMMANARLWWWNACEWWWNARDGERSI